MNHSIRLRVSVYSVLFCTLQTAALPSLALPAIGMPLAASNFNHLAKRCGSTVHHDTLQAIARVESNFNPFAIGVVKGALPRQPRTLDEAVRAANHLHTQGKNFSMGLMQINRYNLARYGLNYETVFDACKNIYAGSKILEDCFIRAGGSNQVHLQKAFSCYYSGNFRFGFTADFKGQPSYVQKVLYAAANNRSEQTVRVPAVNTDTPIAVPERKTASKPVVQEPVRAQTAQSGDDNQPILGQPPKPRAQWDVFGDF